MSAAARRSEANLHPDKTDLANTKLDTASVNEQAGVFGGDSRGLNASEIDCLRWISNGKLRSEISEILGLSETTVNLYLASATQKLAARHTEHAIGLAMRRKIIS